MEAGSPLFSRPFTKECSHQTGEIRFRGLDWITIIMLGTTVHYRFASNVHV